MLARVIEGGREKVYQYWPTEKEVKKQNKHE